MPSSLSSSFFVFGAILTTVSDVAGVLVAAVGLGIEGVRFYLAGNDDALG